MVTAEHHPRAFQQDRQQFELGGRQWRLCGGLIDQHLPVGIQYPMRKTNFPASEASGHRFVAVASPKNRLDAGEQFSWIERLGQIIVRTDFQPHDPIRFLTKRRQHDDRKITLWR